MGHHAGPGTDDSGRPRRTAPARGSPDADETPPRRSAFAGSVRWLRRPVAERRRPAAPGLRPRSVSADDPRPPPGDVRRSPPVLPEHRPGQRTRHPFRRQRLHLPQRHRGGDLRPRKHRAGPRDAQGPAERQPARRRARHAGHSGRHISTQSHQPREARRLGAGTGARRTRAGPPAGRPRAR